MTDPSRSLATEGVRFFGEMSASVSHEIKNVLAIINENAGLLQDVVAMNDRGMPLSPERLAQVAQSISRQVVRGNRIVKKMNRFAHSADHPIETVDVGEVIAFVADLAGRLIAMRGKPPRIETPETPVAVTTNRFYLEKILWVCLKRATEACRPDKEISIDVDKSKAGVRIHFRGMTPELLAGGEKFPSDRHTLVCHMLNARLTVAEKETETIFVLVLHPSGTAPERDG